MKPLESGEALDESFSTPQSQQPPSSTSLSPSSASSSSSSSSDSSIGSPKTSFGNTEEELKTSQASGPCSSKMKNYKNDSMKNCKKEDLGENRCASGTRDPVMAGKRGRKLARRLMEVSSTIPGLKKTDKASVVDEAINYVKQLQERVKVLEERTRKNSAEKTRAFAGEGTSSSMEGLPEIDVKVQGKNVLIKIYCESQKGYLTNILSEIEKLHLKIVTFSALPFADCFLDTTVSAQMGDTFCMTMKDLKRDLRLALMQFMQHAKT